MGTGSLKAAIVSRADAGAEPTVARASSHSYALSSPRPGWAEMDAGLWLGAAERSLADLGNPGGRAGFSGQMHGVVITDEHLVPLRPAITWADTRGADYVPRIAAEVPPQALATLGSRPVAGFAATSLAWVRDNEPEVWARARWFLQVKDWVRARLGGGVFTERSDASGTLLFDLTTGRWSEAMLAWLGIEVDRLAPIVDSTADGGEIVIGGTSRASVIGGADTACVITALGLRTGAGFIAVGSGAQIVRVTDNTALDPATHLCACAGGPDSGFYRIGAVQNAGVALTRVLEILGASTSEANAALEGDIRRDDPLFLPYLAGERTPFMDPTLRGAWHGIGLHTDRQALLRSALEGIAHAVALACEAVTASDGPFEQPVMLVGGGTVDPRFRQLIADATGLTLAPVAAPDAAVLGAGLLAQGITHNPIAPELGDAIVPRESMTALLAERREHHIAHVRRGQEQ